MIKLKTTDETARLIRHVHPQLKRKLKVALRTIIGNPTIGKALREELKGLRSFRVGNIRIVYAIAAKDIIEIITIGPRKTIYEETFRIITHQNE